MQQVKLTNPYIRLIVHMLRTEMPIFLRFTDSIPSREGNRALNLKSPTGGLTCRIPLKARIRPPVRVSSMVPHNIPDFVIATGNSHFPCTLISPSSRLRSSPVKISPCLGSAFSAEG
ncbi:unnamed protein product [Lepeophtheirus salmonis]|uniref:(salmon louse) hypothetical protein n=1 Tax=Lepeophtheirus salmonis TaxID=72036 RepID=A0A7R8CFZ3_LEPSM|nr:unnamed protein product [Lepeophtheirus salmonis]CAF2810946.1 unnamed protein product [Lepeophtheirus salmonis]